VLSSIVSIAGLGTGKLEMETLKVMAVITVIGVILNDILAQ